MNISIVKNKQLNTSSIKIIHKISHHIIYKTLNLSIIKNNWIYLLLYMSSHQVIWIKLTIKQCVSCWITYILQDDTRSTQYQVTISLLNITPEKNTRRRTVPKTYTCCIPQLLYVHFSSFTLLSLISLLRSTWKALKCVAGEDQLDRSCQKWARITQGQRGEKYPTYNRKKEGYLDWSYLV